VSLFPVVADLTAGPLELGTSSMPVFPHLEFRAEKRARSFQFIAGCYVKIGVDFRVISRGISVVVKNSG